jgi:predicted GNAT family acetyltransferase
VDIEGLAAAEAWSARSTDESAELAVETRPEYQRRGYGRQVCAAWANDQLDTGRIAFFSHAVENVASAALAKSLGVRHFMDNVNYA